MSHFRPLPLTAAAALAALCFFWLEMSDMDYAGHSAFGGRTTAGWFVFGFPFVLTVSVGIGLLFAWLARETNHALAWLGAILAAALFVGGAMPRSTPQARLARIIGSEATALATIERLREYDSFNDGTTRWGILSGPPRLMDAIRRHRALDRATATTRLGLYPFANRELPEYGEVEIDGRVTFSVDPASGKIYFCQRPAPRRTD